MSAVCRLTLHPAAAPGGCFFRLPQELAGAVTSALLRAAQLPRYTGAFWGWAGCVSLGPWGLGEVLVPACLGLFCRQSPGHSPVTVLREDCPPQLWALLSGWRWGILGGWVSPSAQSALV